MAKRKPKGILDNPLGEINKLYNAIMPGGRDVTQPQSLAQFKNVVRNTAAGTVKAADLYTTGGLGVSFAQNVIRPATTFSSPETRGAATSKGMTQFAKDAAITAASVGAGAVAGKAVSKGASKVVESGIPARIANIVKRETVVVHGSPVRGLTEIKPQIRKYPGQYADTTPQVFAANPRTERASRTALSYSERSGLQSQKGGAIKDPGSVYIAKAKTKDLTPLSGLNKKNSDYLMSQKPLKVLKEIPTPKAIPSNEGQYKSTLESINTIEKSLKRVGAPKAKPTKWLR
jgi:hypothetical protein